MRRVGYFGGSFDPIHLGHLHLAIEIAERHKLDEILFCPNSQSPHKKETPPKAPKDHRRAMTTAAIAPLPQFNLLDTELQKTGPCYTIDTIETLLATGPKSRYFLVLGEDSLRKLHAWKNVEELLKLAPPLIGTREGKSTFKAPLPKLLQKGLTPIPILQVSSTAIRERLKKGLYCGHLLPAKVWDYIQQHQLYRE